MKLRLHLAQAAYLNGLR